MLPLSICPSLNGCDIESYFRLSTLGDDQAVLILWLADSGSEGITVRSMHYGSHLHLARCIEFTLLAGITQPGLISVDWRDTREALEGGSSGLLALLPLNNPEIADSMLAHYSPALFSPSRTITTLVGSTDQPIGIRDVARAFDMGEALCGDRANVICTAPNQITVSPFMATLLIGHVK